MSFRRVPSGLRRREVRAFARLLREGVARGRDFHCLITDDRELRRLNRRFLGHDRATDVLSFPTEGGARLGEMAISAGRAAAQARAYGHSRLDEIRILMLHGLLHLKGLDHEKDGGAMARAETRWRRKLGLPAGLIARSTT
ncbi:MAG TPA: rRNA maturation RNase YbeY [Bryobacteraceae bacterium]|nr:rRNA maturation RNase YbeY [Bryobacteraceae bacterium]